MSKHEQLMNQSLRANALNTVRQMEGFSLYEDSVHEDGSNLLCIAKKGNDKYLMVLPREGKEPESDFDGEVVQVGKNAVLKCELTHENANFLRSKFDFTNAVRIGKMDSYGFGDRLGNASPAHLRAVRGTGFKPVLAQQSIRELERTNRTPEEVMDAASWAVFQEGYHLGFGADGDHLKTTDDIDVMVKAGYTMFTIDPSDFVVNEVKTMDSEKLKTDFEKLPWNKLEDKPEAFLKRLKTEEVQLRSGLSISVSENEILQGMVKYGRVIAHTKQMANYLADKYPDHPVELELSVDETEAPTTLFEHYLVASELDRLGVELVSLAPRFCGDFEKGIDFKGDLEQFRKEYVEHLAIADTFGGYKLSIHSGSDKFSVYEVVGALDLGAVHIKTAGTSYLEALRTIAVCKPDLFRDVMSFSIKRFNEDKKTYHISADISQIEDPAKVDEDELPEYLDDNHARQVLHVAYGSVLSGEFPEARNFKNQLMTALEEHEDLHYKNLLEHFDKHLRPFE
ncbi:tagaturonate epimerase family protein [Gracilimonas sp.]|uniref:tagaturonate epimerase family protein n=1 Tax=Gracilimonas sp. TaxID=1974203 RepID=UPI003BAD522A